MKNNNCAQSVAMSSTRGHICGEEYNKYRRERIATAVLAGLVTTPDFAKYSVQYSAQMAILAADILIKELDK